MGVDELILLLQWPDMEGEFFTRSLGLFAEKVVPELD